MSLFSRFLFLFAVVFTIVPAQQATAQLAIDTPERKGLFLSLEEALKNPESVLGLDLSNQNVALPDSLLLRFTNLEYLSLKNDRLTRLPEGIGTLKKLKVLDLSGNDFKTLPPTFKNLVNLEELYLNNDRNLDFKQSITILQVLPQLKTLHVEDDGLKRLPRNIDLLAGLETLYMNDNYFRRLPKQLNKLRKLKYLDFHNNRLKSPATPTVGDETFGLKIRF